VLDAINRSSGDPQQHGGTITVDSRVGEYTEFAIHLPRSQQAATAGRAA
jgi:chemotaxis protein histidine kinase CheA